MKKIFLAIGTMIIACTVIAQKYPEPEFSNEVYYLKKDSVNSTVRLEKNVSKMESKTKIGGLGGSETGYQMEGTKSTVRLTSGTSLSFIISTGASSDKTLSSKDSMMKANGFDPSMMSGGPDMNDPATTITLYKTESEKGKRKILMQKNSGAVPFASKKVKSSDKYTFSVKKIREGYWELVIDKTLPKGEYAFSKMDMTGMSAGMSYLLFAFGID